MGVASAEVQQRLSDLGNHTQENLSGIRTIQAMVQEENEIQRFAAKPTKPMPMSFTNRVASIPP